MAQDLTHLHVHSTASLLDGGNTVDKLLARSRDLGMKAVAITDHGVMHNAWTFKEKAKKYGVKPIIGMEAYVAPGDRRDREARFLPSAGFGDEEEKAGSPYSHLVLLAQNSTGYKNLTKLSSLAFKEGFYRKPRVDRELLSTYSEGIIVSSACMAGEVAKHLSRGDFEAARSVVEWYTTTFPGRYYLEVQSHNTPGQAELNEKIFKLASEMNVPVIATCDAHFLEKKDHAAHDCLLCVGLKTTIDNPNRMHYDEGLYFQTGDEVREHFKGRTDILDRTCEIAEQVNLEFTKSYHVPGFPLTDTQKQRLDGMVQATGLDAVIGPKAAEDKSLGAEDREQRAREIMLLEELAMAGAVERYGTLTDVHKKRLRYELDVISNAGYAGYHLIVQDFIQAAKDQNIPVGPGRGSAAGSMVCYAIGITNVDPLPFDLLFERFLNPDRVSMPDIDVDFCYEGRDQIIEYVRQKYGADAVCQIVTFGVMKARAAIKDAGRAIGGFAPHELDAFAKLIPNGPNNAMTIPEAISNIAEVGEKYEGEARFRTLLDRAMDIEGLPRHTGRHAAGILIAPGPVEDYVPVFTMDDKENGRVNVSQYDMNDLEKAGMLKMDFLGLKTLTVLRDAVTEIEAAGLGKVDVDKLALDDAATYETMAKGQLGGVFQMESSLAKDKLTKMKPDRFDDIVATSALLRPGPLESGMTDKFIKRKTGTEAVEYPHPLLKGILDPTQGIIVYQEQVMQAAQILADYTLAEADMLRKAIGKKDAELIEKELQKFQERAVAKGTMKAAEAKELAGLIETFGRYGFNKSHSVAYGLLTYQTAYLKTHYPAYFMAAVLSAYCGDRDDLKSYLEECKVMGLPVKAPHVNLSKIKFVPGKDDADKESVFFGFRAIKGMGDSVGQAIITERQTNGVFVDFMDFVTRTHATGRVNKTSLTALIKAGALDGLGPSRSTMLAVVEPLLKEITARKNKVKRALEKVKKEAEKRGEQMSAFAAAAAEPIAVETVRVPYPMIEEMSEIDLLNGELEVLGLYISGHPMDRWREFGNTLSSHTGKTLERYQEGAIRFAGVVTKCKEETVKANGNKYAKPVVDDGSGAVQCFVSAANWNSYKDVFAVGEFVVVEGKFNSDDNVVTEEFDDDGNVVQGEAKKPDLRVFKASRMMDLIASGEVAVTIRLEPEVKGNATSMERVKQILASHQGNAEVLIEEPGAKPKVANAKVIASPELMNSLRDELGASRVRPTRGRAAYDEASARYTGARRQNSRPRQ